MHNMSSTATKTEKGKTSFDKGMPFVPAPTAEACEALRTIFTAHSSGIAEHGIRYKDFIIEVMALNSRIPIRNTEAVEAFLLAVDAVEERGTRHGYLFREVFPVMISAAADYNQCVGALEMDPEDISLTKRQCFSVMCAAFFCLFPRPCDSMTCSETNLPRLNFDALFCAPASRTTSTVAKLMMFLDYFAVMSQRVQQCHPSLDSPLESIRFVRYKVPVDYFHKNPLEAAMQPMAPCVIHGLRHSIDDQLDMVRVDFANCVIGGGVIGYGCVQEEITFCMYPELNVSRCMHRPLEDDEALVLINAEKFSTIKEGTYGRTTQYGARYTGPRVYNETIVAVDALYFGPRDKQRDVVAVKREIVKFSAGILAVERALGASVLKDSFKQRIATGNWGCGAFNGDVELKFLIQWVVCSMLNIEMHYFPFSEQKVIDFGIVWAAIAEQQVKCGDIVSMLLECERFPQKSVWEVLYLHFPQLPPMAE